MVQPVVGRRAVGKSGDALGVGSVDSSNRNWGWNRGEKGSVGSNGFGWGNSNPGDANVGTT